MESRNLKYTLASAKTIRKNSDDLFISMKKSALLIFLFTSVLVFSQNTEAFNKIYNKTFLETAQKDFPAALKVADSLFLISETPSFKTKSLMLSANLYFQKGNVEKAMELALKAKEIIEPTDEYLMQSKIYGFLSSLYMDLNLYKQSKEYFNKCLKTSDKIEDKNISNNIQGVISQERAQAEIKYKNYAQSIQYVKQSQKHLNLVKDPQPFLLAKNESLLGENYFLLKNYEASFDHYQKALKITDAIPDSYIKGIIYSGLARIYIDKKDEKNAKKYITLAQEISNKSQFLALKKEVNETSEKYYQLTKDLEGLLEVQSNQEVVVENIQKQKDSFVDKSIVDLKKENVVVKEEISTSKIIILGGSICLVFAFLYFLITRKKHRKDFENFQKIMADLRAKVQEHERQIQENSQPKEIFPENKAQSLKTTEKIMIDSTELKLLKKLEKFENSTLFTKNSISLSTLSTYCETNPRYLSNVINSHKGKDFNNYIGELRINYIIEKLERVPKYRKFKIAALAEEAGFSSSNKFATVFKKVTHISPSVFIKYLEENEEKEEISS